MQFTEFTHLSEAIIQGMGLPTGPAYRMFLYKFPDVQTRASKLEILETKVADIPDTGAVHANVVEHFKYEPGVLCLPHSEDPHALLYSSGLETHGVILAHLGRPVYQIAFPEGARPS